VRALHVPLFVLSLGLGVACGDGRGVELEAWDVTITQTSRCTVTGQFARNCDDPAVLGQTTLSARWFVEHADDGLSVTVTTHEGRTIPGVTFDNDGEVIATEGCNGEGGDCIFTRRRFESTDQNAGNCTTFGELIFVAHTPPDDADALVGRFSDVAGNTEECGTPTVNEVAFSVVGRRVDQPARSLEGVQP
jgi:hypothetical protein